MNPWLLAILEVLVKQLMNPVIIKEAAEHLLEAIMAMCKKTDTTIDDEICQAVADALGLDIGQIKAVLAPVMAMQSAAPEAPAEMPA